MNYFPAAALLAAGVALSGVAAVSDRARALQKSALVFDGHIHAIDRIFYHGGDIGERHKDGQFDLPRAKEGGLKAMFFSIFVTEDYYPARFETKQALRMLDTALDQIRKNSSMIEPARNGSDVERITKAGKMAAVLDVEGSVDLDGDPDWANNYADSCCSPPKWRGPCVARMRFSMATSPRGSCTRVVS
jgi:membrane dipeptidase